VIACSASQHGSGETGDAAKIVCEAMCRRELRCDQRDDCARCASLPVRNPPVWSVGWAREVAACMDRSTCAHDADESCAFTSRRTRAAEACAAFHGDKCVVLEGLTPDADARVTACYQQTNPFGADDPCRPDFDWK